MLTKEDQQLWFMLRTRSLNLKKYRKYQYFYDLNCIICKEPESLEDENHLLSCKVLNVNYLSDINSVTYPDVFKSLQQQIKAVTVFKRIWRMREILLKEELSGKSIIN